jgi:hypothetical protein
MGTTESTPPMAEQLTADSAPPAPIAGELPDPATFDPVRFPGQAEDEAWPPTRFDFAAPWLCDDSLHFERDAGGGITLVRRYDHLRLVMDIEGAHRLLDIEPGTRDFRLLRLVPSALRLREKVAPGDPMPGLLLDQDPVPPDEHHVYAATTALVEVLGRHAGGEGLALCEAIRRVPPGQEMFEQAVVYCVTHGGYAVPAVAQLARRLQRLANAHAHVLAAKASQPDYEAMERIVRATRAELRADRRWSGDLLAHALAAVVALIDRPRITAEALAQRADAALRHPGAMSDLSRLIDLQRGIHDRLMELATFWQRLAAAWLSVDPETTDRREVEALARNALRRLSLETLYRAV